MDDMRIVLDKNATELTVMDVYDIAAVMGLEFEHIADQFGCEALLRLMPKVVRVLEMLEVLVARNNNSETEELRRDLDMLRLERKDRLEKEKIRLRELELVEDVWRGEAQDRLSQITQLEVENKRLQKSLSLKDSHVTEEELQRKEGVSEREHQVMMKLKDMVDKQRGDIQEKDHELNLKNEDLKALQLQHHCLRKINLELRHRVRMMDAQCKTVIQQKAEVEAMSQGRQQELEALRQEVARLKEERQHWKLKRAEEEVREEECFESADSHSLCAVCDEVPDALELKEDDSPRFTLQELQDVLQERNELKAQVFMLQEELIYYKSEELEDEINGVCCDSPHESEPSTTEEPASRIKHLIFTAVMPMVAAGLIADDPTLQPIRRFMSFV
ncbi:RILP-like protein 1 [Esox lucius]|uniref:RILP-like protein 1 n=1 Tax=Esox lucius TaxID=8010 RepID=UPI001476A020|nr:RILP-like protein 1 [Esox lucius]